MQRSLRISLPSITTAGGTLGRTIIAAKLATAAGGGDLQKVKVMSNARIPTTLSTSTIDLVSRIVHGCRRKKPGRIRFADGRMKLTLNARTRAIVVVTGVKRQEARKSERLPT